MSGNAMMCLYQTWGPLAQHHHAISPKSQDFDCEAWRPCPAKYSKSTYLEYIDVGSLFPRQSDIKQLPN